MKREKLTVLLHDGEELDHDLGGRADEHLALAALLGVEHVLEGIVENTNAHHGDLPAALAATTTTRNRKRIEEEMQQRLSVERESERKKP